MTTLKPCPFCGGEAIINRTQGDWGRYPSSLRFVCSKCWASPPGGHISYESEEHYGTKEQAEQKAAANWNRRVNPHAALMREAAELLGEIRQNDPFCDERVPQEFIERLRAWVGAEAK